MPKTRKQKEESVVNIASAIKSANSVVFAGFNKLRVVDERELRRQLRVGGVSYTVAKKSLWKRAMELAGFPNVPEINGQLALAYGTDSMAPAKGIVSFAKKHEGMISTFGGIFEGKLVDAGKIKMIATIPSRETLLGMLANVLSAPMRGLAISLNAVAKSKSDVTR